MTTLHLPPNTRYRNGQLVRRLTVEIDGVERRIRRPVALTLEDARKENADFYDAVPMSDGLPRGWIRGGKKLEREHPEIKPSGTFTVDDDEEDDDAPDDDDADED